MIKEAWNGFLESLDYLILAMKNKKYDNKLKKHYEKNNYPLVVCNKCRAWIAEFKADGMYQCKHCAADNIHRVRLELIWNTEEQLAEGPQI